MSVQERPGAERAREVAGRIVRLLEAAPLRWATEAELQRHAGERLAADGFEVARELVVSGGRLDLLAEVDGVRVAVEVKTQGTLGALIQQVHRYAKGGDVDAVVALVGRARLVVDAHQVVGVPVVSALARGF